MFVCIIALSWKFSCSCWWSQYFIQSEYDLKPIAVVLSSLRNPFSIGHRAFCQQVTSSLTDPPRSHDVYTQYGASLDHFITTSFQPFIMLSSRMRTLEWFVLSDDRHDQVKSVGFVAQSFFLYETECFLRYLCFYQDDSALFPRADTCCQLRTDSACTFHIEFTWLACEPVRLHRAKWRPPEKLIVSRSHLYAILDATRSRHLIAAAMHRCVKLRISRLRLQYMTRFCAYVNDRRVHRFFVPCNLTFGVYGTISIHRVVL